MSFTMLPVVTRGVILVILTIILYLYIYCFIRTLNLKKKTIDSVMAFVMLMVTFGIFEVLTMIQQGDLVLSFPIPLGLLIPVMVLLFVYSIILHINILRWRRDHISAMSVKEAFDRLPMGVMFYMPEGIPIMINESMNKVSDAVFRRPITDGRSFWLDLCETAEKQGNDDRDRMIIKCVDSRAYSIKRDLIKIKGSNVYELTAVDISREYELTGELDDRSRSARIINNRLKALLSSIEYVTMNRELLQLKTALHDNIGQSILIAKRYLYAPESVDRERMYEFWSSNIRHLISEEHEEWELPYYVISKEADQLGLSLNIIGELPVERRLIPVVDRAISTHLGNTLKHTSGTEITVTVKEEGMVYIMSLTNNGKNPSGKVNEKGGLANLRRDIEEVGGMMEIKTEPGFELRITLPRGE